MTIVSQELLINLQRDRELFREILIEIATNVLENNLDAIRRNIELGLAYSDQVEGRDP